MIIGAGMVMLMMNVLMGTVTIVFGICLIIIIYFYRIFTSPEGEIGNRKFWVIRRINYIPLIIGGFFLILIVLNSATRDLLALLACMILIIPFIVNILNHKKDYFIMYYGYCQLRIAVILALVLLFHFFLPG